MALQTRPPVITIMGHVDHGKTSLLDFLRKSRIAAKEAGGITQHIGAYQIEHNGKALTFIDTPGHAAFNKMRERGSKITDIVVLVVAADDGVKPQTVESIRHIKQANVTVVVAINKIDLATAYPDMVKSQLVEHGIQVQGYGGDIDVVELSAKTGQGVDKLLETLAVTAELMELKADPAAPLEAVVIESTKDSRKGSVASVIVRQGTLKVRQDLVVEGITGRVRRLADDLDRSLDEVLPGCPAEIIGLSEVPSVGSMVHDASVAYSEADGAAGSDVDHPFSGEAALNFPDALKFDDIFNEQPKLKLIIKADVEGTLEAIRQNLDAESVELLDSSVGELTERDLEFAQTTGAKIITFHIDTPRRIKDLAKRNNIKIKKYDVIYQLIEDLQKQMLRVMDSTIDETVTGEAEILQLFEMRGERIAGCRVLSGILKKGDKLHLKRGDTIIADPTLKSMMQGKLEITEAKAKTECGVTFRQNKLQFQVGDHLVAYTVAKEED
jgi:translation initiation factor IF-2